jgi:hypothetical protein
MATIGTDCDIILVHPDVNGGDPYGFVLAPDQSNRGSSVSVQRELDDEDEIQIYIFFTILLADELRNPDGSMHADTRENMYSMLLLYLAQTTDLSIGMFMGTYLGVGPMGHSATELHLIDGSYISCKLTNITPTTHHRFRRVLWFSMAGEYTRGRRPHLVDLVWRSVAVSIASPQGEAFSALTTRIFISKGQ